MNANFSLTMPTIRFIQRQAQDTDTKGIQGFIKRELITRVTALSLSIFASIDFALHLSGAAAFAFYAMGKSIIMWQNPNFEGTIRHLTIALLFRRAIIYGTLWGIQNPSTLRNLVVNDSSTMISALVFSKKPKFFQQDVDGFTFPKTLSHFCAIANTLPEEVQSGMKQTLQLLKDAKSLDPIIDNHDIKIKAFTSEERLKKIDTFFKDLQKPRVDDSKTKIFLTTKVASRVAIVGMTLFSAYLVVAKTCSLMTELLIFCLLIPLKIDEDLPEIKNAFSEILKVASIDLLQLLRSLIGVIACPTLGLLDPFFVQKILFSPLYENEKAKTVNNLLNKIEIMPKCATQLIPVTLYTDDPKKSNSAHGICLIIKKLDQGYSVSVCNRGDLNWVHKASATGSKREVDVSWDNVDLETVKLYVKCLLYLNEPIMIQSIMQAISATEIKEKKAFFLFMIYHFIKKFSQGKELKEINSNHYMISQKIGNCYLTSLFGAISLYHEKENVNNPNQAKNYRNFVFQFKKQANKQYGYLLDFDTRLSPNLLKPASALAQELLDKQAKSYS